jgi:Uncharacterized protein conserved in bacteria
MRKYRLKQTVSILLSMILAFSCMNAMAPVRAADESEPDAVLVACSDFQNFDDSNNGAYSGSYTNNIALVKRILNAMQYERIDGFLCGGDYNFAETINSVSQTQTGIDAVRNAVTDIYPTLPDERIVLVQGNHDATGTSGMASTGPYETDHYSIYVINEDDYMDRNTDEARIKATSEALAAWLEQKCEEDYDRPVFVATHLPLHFTTRTQKNGDGQYARYLFDVLNKYGDQLNLFYLFGHNHAFGYDSYMGASSIFLQRGDGINLAQLGSRTRFAEETLHFTYMNYGYTGYYWFNYNTSGGAIKQNPPADSTMTMTSFEITGNDVVVHRWDEDGLHNLKAPGALITKAMNGTDYEDTWPVNDVTYGPTARIDAPAPAVTYTCERTGVSVTTTAPIGGIEDLGSGESPSAWDYDLRPLVEAPEGYTYTVTLLLPAALATRYSAVTRDGTELSFQASPDPEDPDVGQITFRTDRLGAFRVSTGGAVTSYTRVTDLAALPDSGQYLLFVSNTNKTSGSNLNADYVMRPVSKYVNSAGTEVALGDAYRTGFDIESALRFDIDNSSKIIGSESTLEWTLERSGAQWLLKTADSSGVSFAYRDADAATVTLSATDPTPLAIARYGSTDTFTVGTASAVNGVTYYFDYNTRGLICGYRAHANDVHFYLYRQETSTGSIVDTAYLETALAEAAACREEDYVPDTWAPLAAAAAKADAVLADPGIAAGAPDAQSRVNVAWIALRNALAGLELTLEKQGIRYEAVTDPAALSPDREYYLVLWADFGAQTEGDRIGALVRPGNRMDVPSRDDYATLSPDRALPADSAWRIISGEAGIILRHVQSGGYAAGSGALLDDCPRFLQLTGGTCGEYENYALGSGEYCLAMDGAGFGWAQMPASEAAGMPSGANLTIYEKTVQPERVNLAADSTVEAPAISSWCNAGGVIDGVIPDSSDTGDYNVAYGSWNGSGSPTEQTITLRFDRRVCVDGAAAFFWYNAGGTHNETGIDFPASYTWQYLNDAGTWTEVPAPSGYSVSGNVMNVTQFEPVTTTAARIVMQKTASGSFGLGVAELELYGYYVGQTDDGTGPDLTALELALAEAVGIDPAPYTDETAAALAEAVETGRTALHDPAARQERLDDTAEAVREAIAAMKTAGSEVDRQILNKAVADAEEIDKEQYTEDSAKALEKALAAAKAMQANADATQAEVDEAAKALNDAVAALEEKSAPPEADKSALERAVAEAEIIDKEQYTESSVKALEEALAAAKAMQANADAMQAEVDEAAKALNDAIAALEEKPVPPEADKSALEKAIEDAEALDTEAYTAESVEALAAAIEAAREALENAGDQDAVDAAVAALAEVIEALEEKPGEPEEPDFLFDDVQDDAKFYFNPVYWAFKAQPQITNGLTAATFGPDAGCTRGQVVTFLWRAAGCPAPESTETAFTDMKDGAFYLKAVAWAVENEITNGMTATTFAPDVTCTRGQIVTFLWRFKGKPAPKSKDTSFTDVAAGAFYEEAVAWAVENKVTNGMTTTTFAPGSTCTRGQVVTFLYRTAAE